MIKILRLNLFIYLFLSRVIIIYIYYIFFISCRYRHWINVLCSFVYFFFSILIILKKKKNTTYTRNHSIDAQHRKETLSRFILSSLLSIPLIVNHEYFFFHINKNSFHLLHQLIQYNN